MGISSQPIQVLWLAKGLGPGGMERLLVHHARLGDRTRFRYVAAYLVDRPESVVRELESLDVECIRLGRSGGATAWLRDLRTLVRERDVDVVHSHSPMPATGARVLLTAARHSPPHVYTEHCTWGAYGAPTRVANASTYPLDDAQFAVSEGVRRSVPRLLRRHVEVLSHGIDLEDVRASPVRRAEVRAALDLRPDHVVVTNVANLRSEKGVDVLLDATADLVRDHPEVVVLSVGHGPRQADLLARHAALGLGDRFRFLGFRSDVPELLGVSDVFCLSSRQEGLPLAFMEASAAGLPTVATSVGGLGEHISNGVNGYLVPPDDARALSTALARVAVDAPLRLRMGEAAHEMSAVFDARTAIEHQERCYEQLQSGRSGRSGS